MKWNGLIHNCAGPMRVGRDGCGILGQCGLFSLYCKSVHPKKSDNATKTQGATGSKKHDDLRRNGKLKPQQETKGKPLAQVVSENLKMMRES